MALYYRGTHRLHRGKVHRAGMFGSLYPASIAENQQKKEIKINNHSQRLVFFFGNLLIIHYRKRAWCFDFFFGG